MQFRKSISLVVLLALLTWSMSALCAPVPIVSGSGCPRMAYRTMVIEHPRTHSCCAPEKMIVLVCYRMHGDGECSTMTRCMTMHGDEAISGTAKYHDDGQARACATAHATNLLIGAAAELSGATWEQAALPHSRPILDLKTDLRI